MENQQIQLKATSILTVPLHTYEEDFRFIVNGKEFKTSRIISDILSPKISQMHSIDPTFNEFHIKTRNQGDFNNILKLASFSKNEIPKSEIPFLAEIVELFENISIEIPNLEEPISITSDNVISVLKNEEQYKFFYSKSIQKLIDFISTKFFEIVENQKDEMKQLSLDTLIQIVKNSKLQLNSESQLLKFINQLYVNDTNASVLYEFVQFTNVDSESIEEFLDIFNINDITIETWGKLKEKLRGKDDQNSLNSKRYKKKEKKGIEFKYDQNHHFDGIFAKNIKGNISDFVNITSSSHETDYRLPTNVVQYNSYHDSFYSQSKPNQWICFEFKNHRVIPSCYEILSSPFSKGNYHPRSWVIEGSNDGASWKTIDKQVDCSYLNDKSVIHCFPIEDKENNDFRYLRFHSTGKDWRNCDYIMFHSIEFYGQLM